MKSDLKAIITWDNSNYTPSTHYSITKDGVTLELSQDDWKELMATIRGKRKYIYTPLKEGSYIPELVIHHNHLPGTKTNEL